MLPPSCCTVINGTAAPTQSDSADHAAPARFYRNCRLDLFCVGWARPALSKGSAHKHSAALPCPQCLPHACHVPPCCFPTPLCVQVGLEHRIPTNSMAQATEPAHCGPSLPLCHTSTACPTHIMPPICPISPLMCVQGCAMADIVSNLLVIYMQHR